jgi:3-deoxy-D-manno-octulosonic-acid transferase
VPRLQSAVASDKGNLVWMHCASLGEFEQGRPLLEAIRKSYPSKKVLLTFFSPSGYEVKKNYRGADHIFYLPMDSEKNAVGFIEATMPSLAIFVKYEFWYYFLSELGRKKIPTILVSGIFRKEQPFFRSYGSLWRSMLKNFTHFFVQTQESVVLLSSVGLDKNVSLSGDTRFDRVIEIAENSDHFPEIVKFCAGHRVLVAGSTWPEDEEVLDHYANTNPAIRFIIVPHEVHEDHLRQIGKLFKHSTRYTRYQQSRFELPNGNVLVIDNIGMLSRLYRYADICFVGGGFGGDGIHNILEAAVYGKPVIFGPEHYKFQEALDLIDLSGAISVESALDLEKTLDQLFSDSEALRKRGEAASSYVYAKAGATKKIMDFIQENRLLTN